jgi:hypothetical protein
MFKLDVAMKFSFNSRPVSGIMKKYEKTVEGQSTRAHGACGVFIPKKSASGGIKSERGARLDTEDIDGVTGQRAGNRGSRKACAIHRNGTV